MIAVKVNVYCSYKGSPVGFQIGSFSYDKDRCVDWNVPASPFQELSSDVSSFIKACFELGLVSSVCGKSPKSENYIYLVKELEKLDSAETGAENASGIKLYINLAFEFATKEEYESYLDIGDLYKLKKAALNFVVPDVKAETYALKIDKKSFAQYMNELHSKEEIKSDDLLHIKAKSTSDYTTQIAESLDLDPEFLSKEKPDSKEYFYPKKKIAKLAQIVMKVRKYSRHLMIIVGALAIVLVGTLMNSCSGPSAKDIDSAVAKRDVKTLNIYYDKADNDKDKKAIAAAALEISLDDENSKAINEQYDKCSKYNGLISEISNKLKKQSKINQMLCLYKISTDKIIRANIQKDVEELCGNLIRKKKKEDVFNAFSKYYKFPYELIKVENKMFDFLIEQDKKSKNVDGLIKLYTIVKKDSKKHKMVAKAIRNTNTTKGNEFLAEEFINVR